jgi:hypothetical protein
VGVNCDSADVAAVIIGENPDAVKAALSSVSKRVGAEPDETVLELSNNKVQSIREAFSVSDGELETVVAKGDVQQALVNLVIERMALLATQL